MINSLYFNCYYCFLRGDLPETKMYYDFLKEEFRKKKDINALKPHQLYELKRIREALITGNLSRGSWMDETPTQGPPTQPTAKLKQDELVWKINKEIDQLKNILRDDVKLYNLEHPCGMYGACDMVYIGEKTVYPVEIKKDQGKHDIIGQIMKYDLHFKFHLHYRHYDFVQGATICSSYDPYTLQELKKLKIKTILYSIIGDKLSLKML